MRWCKRWSRASAPGCRCSACQGFQKVFWSVHAVPGRVWHGCLHMHKSVCLKRGIRHEWIGAQEQHVTWCRAEETGVWGVQGDETELLLEEVNSYQRAIQYQQLEKAQFGASEPPGFYHEAST